MTEEEMLKVVAAALDLVEDADLVDGDMYGYLVGVGVMDTLREALRPLDRPI